MMLKKLKLCALLMTACVGSLAGYYDPSNGQWRLTGEWLYLQPSFDDTFFVIDSPVTTEFPNGKRKNNDFNFQSGYRVGAGYTFCDCNRELQFAYTNLNVTSKKEVTGDFLWATVGNPDLTSSFENYAGVAASELKNKYQRLDALYAQQLYDCCDLEFAVKFGLEAVELKLTEYYAYESEANLGLIEQYSKVKGIGPQIGFAVGYELYKGTDCCPGSLSLNVLTSGSLLAANCKTFAGETLDDEIILDVSNSKSWRVVPALHASVGLNYDMSFSCVDASFEVGYEFSSYLRGLSRLSFTDDVGEGNSRNDYYNFDLQGLYVSGSIRF